MHDIIRVQTQAQISEVAALAHSIWTEHYTPIIGRAQVDYMLANFQSEQAIATQIADGYDYFLATRDQQSAGYFAIVPDASESRCLISKIYVVKAARSNGIGRTMLDFAEDICRKRNLDSLWLTVNKQNTAAIQWYTRMGFRNVGPTVQDIGGGFVMDDYRMTKHLTE